MTIKRMKEVVASTMQDCLCCGCEEGYEDDYKPDSCCECRAKVAVDVCEILSWVDDMLVSCAVGRREE